nr:nucleotide-binding alpha-beta plait domain-containing protein [Tanacetum cinerariifolium]
MITSSGLRQVSTGTAQDLTTRKVLGLGKKVAGLYHLLNVPIDYVDAKLRDIYDGFTWWLVVLMWPQILLRVPDEFAPKGVPCVFLGYPAHQKAYKFNLITHSCSEDGVSRISTSIYVSNFPESFSAKDLFHSCKQYGHVVDTFIPFKRSRDGKRFHGAPLNNNKVPTEQKFGYNRNINNVRAKEGVTTGSSKFYVHAVKVKNMFGALECDFMPSIDLDDECLIFKDLSKALLGSVKEFASLPNLKIVLKNEGKHRVGSWFSVLKQASFDFIPEGRIVWVEIEGVPFKLWSKNTFKRIAAKWGELLDVDDQEEESFL